MRLIVELDHVWIQSGQAKGVTIMDPYHRRDVVKVYQDDLGLHAVSKTCEEYWDLRIVKRWWCEA